MKTKNQIIHFIVSALKNPLFNKIMAVSKKSLILFTFISFFLSGPALSQPAFPGASGFGSKTPGGRGGKVIFVTNLNPDGPGSLTEACEASGARIVIFRVGGTITLEKDIQIKEPFITIAGQTAPGDGICIRGGALSIFTHDVIVRGLRIRIGDGPGPTPENRDAIKINNRNNPPYNIIIDHCSFSWAIDETVQLWYPCRDITVQWCIISESLHKSLHPKGPHGTGIIIGDHAKNISIHHNLLAHNNGRNPLMKLDTESEFINNVVYNWGTWQATGLSNYENKDYPILANIIGNYYKTGPDKSPHKPVQARDKNLRPGTKIYVKDNVWHGRMSDDTDEWSMVTGDVKFRADEPALPLSDVPVLSARVAYKEVLEHAGAIVPKHDAVDIRMIDDVNNGTGKIINSQTEVGGWPVYTSASPPTDSDNDGMPDYWEDENGLNKNDPADAKRKTLSKEGNTNIEVYINSLVDQAIQRKLHK